IKQVNVKKEDISKILQSDYNDHITIFGPKDFYLILFCDDDGPALLLDDYKKLTLDDLRFLLEKPFDIGEKK
ncbi:24681_t:CDS:2, partial [Racocetra persica]